MRRGMMQSGEKKSIIFGYIYTKKKVSIEARQGHMIRNPVKMEWVVGGDATPSVYKGNYGNIPINDNTGTAIVQFNYADQIVALDFLIEQITSIDISQCVKIEIISFFENQLTSVDLSNNPMVKQLNVGNNPNYSGLNLNLLPLLEILEARSTKISGTLDFSVTPNIKTINLTNCSLLKRLVLLGCAELTTITMSSVKLNYQLVLGDCLSLERIVYRSGNLGLFATKLSFLNNSKLNWIDIGINGFTEATAPSFLNLLDLERLIIFENQIMSIDVSSNVNLNYLHLGNCGLTSLDITNNPLLSYIDIVNNNFTPGVTDQIIIDINTHGKSGGQFRYTNNRTSSSDTAYNALLSRGWTITEV